MRLDGIGPIRVGMTLAEASAKIGHRLRYETVPEHGDCGFAELPGMSDVVLMVIDGRVRRVEAGQKSTIVTVSGVGRGATEAEVLRAYGGRVQVQPHPYGPGGHYLLYESDQPSQRGFLLIFETDGSRVTSFRAGEREAVELVEGCV